MKRLLKILTAAVAVILLFTACQQFLEDPEDFLSYWASETFVKNHSIDSAHRPDKAGVPCVGSSAEVPITLSVHNPKGFSFVMPTSSAPAGIVEFKELFSQPTAETDYALERTGPGTLKLTYKPSLLQKYEQGLGSLNPTITLKAKDGRVFKKTYTFGIKSNTPPPAPKDIVIAKTKITVTEPKSYYVLCLKFDPDEMKKKVTLGSGQQVPVHKDIKKITINDSSYTLLYNGNSDFQIPAGTTQIGSFIEHGDVAKLTEDIPAEGASWVLYFKTEVPVESANAQTSYTITLRDEGGVVSDSVTQDLEKKFKVEFDANGGNYTPNTQYILKGDKVTKPSPNPERPGHIFGGWYTDTSYLTQWDFGTNTVTSNMRLYAKWTEAKYTVKFRVADGEGTLKGSYDDGSYHSQTAQKDGGEVKLENVPHGTQVTFTATPADGWEVDRWTGVSSSSLTATLTVDSNKTVTVEFKKVTVVEGTNNLAWTLLQNAVKVADPNSTITIDGKIEASSGNSGEIEIDETLTIEGKTGPDKDILDANGLSRIFKVASGKTLTLKNLTLTGGKATGTGDAGSGGAIFARDASEIKIENCIITGNEAYKNGGGLNVEGTPTTITNCTFTGNTAKNGGGIYIMETSTRRPVVTISGGTIGGTDTDKANKATGTGSDGNGGGIYVGDWCDLRLNSTLLIIGNQAAKGGGVYAKNVLQVSMKNGTRIAVNNDVYLDSGSWIKVFSTLSNNPAARITVPNGKYLPSTKVLDGNAALLNSEHAKFQVTPKGSEQWTVDSNGYLTKGKTAVFDNITKDQIEAAIAAASSMIYGENATIDRTELYGKLVLYRTKRNGHFNYGIMHVTNVNNSGGGYIKFNYKTFRAYETDVLQENNKVVNGDAKFDLDTGNVNVNGSDFHLENTTSQKRFKVLDDAKFYILSN